MGRLSALCTACVYLAGPLAAGERLVVGWNPQPGPTAPAQSRFTVGFIAEVLNEAAAREGIHIEWRETHNAFQVEQSLDNGSIDLYPAAISTKYRRARYYLTEPWWHEDLAFVVRL